MMLLRRQCRAVLRVTQLAPRALLRSGLVLATGFVAVTAATDLFARPFIPTPSFQAGSGPSRIVAGDFNGDGRGDLAVANVDSPDGSATVGLLVGEGGGLLRYAGVVFTFMPETPQALYGGDFNQDGKPDLLLETSGIFGTFSVNVLLGQGNGAFVPVPAITVAGPAFLADGNADGRPDLIVQSGNGASSRLQVWLGALNGTFAPLAAFTAPAGVDFSKRPLAVGDLNGDRIADVVATNSAATASVVLRGAANGTYAGVQTLATGMPRLMASIADFTGDGAADLVVEEETANSFIVLQAFRGRGDGTFDVSPFWNMPVGSTNGTQWITDLSSGDLNGDGARDLAGVSLEGVQIFLGGGGGFTSWGTFAVGLNPSQVVFGDLDGAGARDIAVVHAFAVTLVLAAPDGSWLPHALPQSDVVSAVPRIVTGDFTGDGLLDVAALHAHVPPCEDLFCPWGEVEAWPALAAGGFGAPALYPIGVAPSDLRAVDLDRDGKLDLVAVNQGGDATNPAGLSLLRGLGDGTFEAEVRVPLAIRPAAVTAGDFDRDGDIDLAVANDNDSSITVLLRTPAGGYAPQPSLPPGRIPIRIQAVDLDGDGILDLAVADQGKYEPATIPGDVCWFRGRGNGTFDPRVVLFSGMRRTSDLTVADLDADGDPDLVVTDEYSYTHEISGLGGAFSVIRNQGAGVFVATSYPSDTFPLQVRVADLNGDGSVDLLIENGADDLGLFPGLGDGTFGPAQRFSVWGCRNFEPARLAGDGDVDLLTACGNVSRIENEATPANPALLFLDASRLGWDPVDLVTGYDVIRGSLSVLRSSGGNFGQAVQACVQNNGPLHTVDLATPNPLAGSGFFYLVRAIGWNGAPGSYDGEPGQAHPRDASIQSSAGACP